MSVFTNEEERKRVKNCLEEISNSLTRIEAEREFIKEATNSICDELALDKKHFRDLIKLYHKRNYTDVSSAFDEVSSMYEIITGETIGDSGE